MIIRTMMAGVYGVNCYILFDETTKEAVVLDPGGDVEKICKIVDGMNAKVKYIILTHGHFDHTTGVEELKVATGAPVVISKEDNDMIMNQKMYFGPFPKSGADILVGDGDVLKFGNCKIKAIFTPGHTPGGMSYLVDDNNIFTGDTLFQGSIGRTDLIGGNYSEIIKSINDKLMKLSDNVAVHPGHGSSTTIGRERVENPFVNR